MILCWPIPLFWANFALSGLMMPRLVTCSCPLCCLGMWAAMTRNKVPVKSRQRHCWLISSTWALICQSTSALSLCYILQPAWEQCRPEGLVTAERSLTSLYMTPTTQDTTPRSKLQHYLRTSNSPFCSDLLFSGCRHSPPQKVWASWQESSVAHITVVAWPSWCTWA